MLLNTNVASKSKWKDVENKNMDMALALIIEPVCLLEVPSLNKRMDNVKFNRNLVL